MPLRSRKPSVPGRPSRRAQRRAPAVLGALVAVTCAGGLGAESALGASQTISGTQMVITAEDVGNLQARLTGSQANVFFPPNATPGASGLFIGFPVDTGPPHNGRPGIAAGTVYGPPNIPSGPSFAGFTPISQAPVSGSGSGSDPLTQVTTYKVVGSDGKDYLSITQTVQYVNGATQFQVSYAIHNVTDSASGPGPTGVRFRASGAADTYIAGADEGVGYFSTGPPRFVGGYNPNVAGGAGGILEVTDPASAAWSHYQEGRYSAIWNAVLSPAGQGFNDTIDANLVDNGVGVEWDNHHDAGADLAPGATETYSMVWRFVAPADAATSASGRGSGIANLVLSPPTAVENVGDTHQVTVSLSDLTGHPLRNAPVRYTVAGANPISSALATTNDAGQAIIRYTGRAGGDDSLTAYADLNNDGVRQAGEPQAKATVTWRAAVSAVGTVKVNKYNQDIIVDAQVCCAGTLTGTATIVPGQQGDQEKAQTAGVAVAVVAKTHTYGTGSVTAKGPSQVALAIKPSAAARRMLRRRGHLAVSVHLAFRATGHLGSTSSSKDFRVKVKARKH